MQGPVAAAFLVDLRLVDKVVIAASPEAADLLFKAVKQAVGEYPETNDLQRQNPAAKRLVDEVDRAFDLMAENLIKQVEKIFADEDKTSAEVKAVY